ncbi:hypothetical protein H2199_008826, partial [Coniosporium tulheliwenetii]
MLTGYHKFDPRGDVKLVLERHSCPQEIPDGLLPLAERDDSQNDLAPSAQSEEAPAELTDAPAEAEEIPAEPVETWAETEDAPPEPVDTWPEPVDAPAEAGTLDSVVALAELNHADAP